MLIVVHTHIKPHVLAKIRAAARHICDPPHAAMTQNHGKSRTRYTDAQPIGPHQSGATTANHSIFER
jgi:hypothetical protein